MNIEMNNKLTLKVVHHGQVLEENWWNDLSDEEFQETFRMSKPTMIDLQAEIDRCEDIHQDRVEKLLLLSVWFLGNTKSFEEAERLFGVTNFEEAVKVYLMKILKLGVSYILWPALNELEVIANGFATEYEFPGVVGVIGSLHIEIDASEEGDSNLFYNNVMEKHTIVLQVVCDNNLLLRDVCVGCPGGKSIREILESSPLYSLLTDKESLLVINNLHVLGGTEHPQLEHLLTPYTFADDKKLALRQRQFNLLHSVVMCTVERTFRCLEIRFPRLTSVERLNHNFSSLIASSICVLHNFTRVRNDCCELYL